jgi:NADPH:quinone reductase-like Zn-dependent oxidoreductase
LKAIAYDNYGAPEVLHPVDLAKPKPAADQLLVRVHATSVTAGDSRARGLDLPPGFGLIGRLVFGLFRPRQKVLGTEFSGIIEAVGAAVKDFQPGDRVFGYPGGRFGSYAEYVTIGEDQAIAHAPGNITLEEAAALSFGGATALNFLRDKGSIKAGETVLVIGASGGVGNAAVQLAKDFGAHVTAVASTSNLAMVETLGADAVIDYTKADPAGARDAYDIILDTSGTATYAKYGKTLRPGGRLLLVSANLWQMIGSLLARKTGGRKAIPGYAPERAEDLRFLAGLAAKGRFKPFIGRRFGFSQMAMAHAHFQSPEKKGNIVVVMETA